NFVHFLLFNSFFPKVSLGPIMRYQEFIGQLNNVRGKMAIPEDCIKGVNRILLGLFKKLVLADRLSAITTPFYDSPITISGANAWVAVLLFLLQLYFDFSGYMDLAMGSAHLFGFKLKENFNLPLRSISISDFWRRWHISLVDWLTIYIYYPINFHFRRYKQKATVLAIVVTFFLSGLWHGWGFTFICYALLHALYILIEVTFKRNPGSAIRFLPGRWNRALNYTTVFLLVALSLIFFRSPSIDKAVHIFQYLFNFTHFINPDVSWSSWLINGGANIEVTFNNRLSIVLSMLFILYERTINKTANTSRFNFKYLFIFIAAIVLFGAFGSTQRFIYLQF
ncbi:MAG TPA: MBOAT family O-acyltransferase, partial [Chitinophagaceae bacterium]|nr:MBOAT family O-acyltransferase [Chitinophagaceae bacterium]